MAGFCVMTGPWANASFLQELRSKMIWLSQEDSLAAIFLALEADLCNSVFQLPGEKAADRKWVYLCKVVGLLHNGISSDIQIWICLRNLWCFGFRPFSEAFEAGEKLVV